MEQFIKELYNGNINASAKTFERNSDFAKAIKIISDNEEKLLHMLDERNVQLLKESVNAQMEVNSITGLESFTDGFKLGARLIIEVMEGDENQIFKNLVRLQGKLENLSCLLLYE